MRSRERGTGSGQCARGKVRPESKGQGQAREQGTGSGQRARDRVRPESEGQGWLVKSARAWLSVSVSCLGPQALKDRP